jgi:hypothetical protein
MSKKSKTNSRENKGGIAVNDLSAGKSNGKSFAVKGSHIDSSAGNKPAKGGVFSYLKSHLWIVGIIAFLVLGTLGAGLKYLDDEAQRETSRRNAQKNAQNNRPESFLNKINPFLPALSPTPTPTPLPRSKEYIYAGSRTLAVIDANANEVPPSDLAIWRPSNGQWWIMSGTGTQQLTVSWGISGDKPIPGDYDGDGKSDFALFRPTNTTTPSVVNKGTWYISNSAGGGGEFDFGLHDDMPVPADYDGDSRTDIAVWRKSDATWYIIYSSTNTTVYGSLSSTPTSTDIPAPADYDGDGKADLAIFTGSVFHILNSSNLQQTATTYGSAGDLPVSADYDGDGKADIALWRSSDATWHIKQSSNSSTSSMAFGIGTDTPVQNDYDGDGKCDIAVWRGTASTSPGGDVGKWFIRNSTNPSNIRVEWWGVAGDKPVPAFWKRQ